MISSTKQTDQVNLLTDLKSIPLSRPLKLWM